jgi:hypothetical protein
MDLLTMNNLRMSSLENQLTEGQAFQHPVQHASVNSSLLKPQNSHYFLSLNLNLKHMEI